VSRSTLRAPGALDLSMRWAAGKAPAGHRPALLWLRLRRVATSVVYLYALRYRRGRCRSADLAEIFESMNLRLPNRLQRTAVWLGTSALEFWNFDKSGLGASNAWRRSWEWGQGNLASFRCPHSFAIIRDGRAQQRDGCGRKGTSAGWSDSSDGR
jgi:hypothetical protein